MSSDSKTLIINGSIACAGAVLAIVSYGMLVSLGDVEAHSVSTIELRVAILLGGIISAVAIGNQFYNRKERKKEQTQKNHQLFKMQMNKTYLVIPLAFAVGFLIFPFVAYYGNDIMVVTSTSMLPTLKPNDLIVVEPTTIDKIKVGDIITFDSNSESFDIIAHRTIEVSEIDGEIAISTKGDNVENKDGWRVRDSDLIGKVIEVVPTLGIFLVGPVRFTLVIVIIITAVALLKDQLSSEQKGLKKKS